MNKNLILFFILSLSIHTYSQCWKDVKMGTSHTIALKTDGTLWAWGDNSVGELGNGTNNDSSIPLQIGQSNDWKIISAGGSHNLAIKNDGTLWAWGWNIYGQLGDSTFVNSNIPIQVGTDNNWKNVESFAACNIAQKNDGSIWGWGDNTSKVLGNISSIGIPTKIGTDTDWKRISVGGKHTLAIKNDGSLWGWGSNLYGQLGTNNINESETPIRIGNDTDWKNISAGGNCHSLGIKTNGTIWSWGRNEYGELGDGSYIDKSNPTQIGTENNWKEIFATNRGSLAIKNDLKIWNWGVIDMSAYGVQKSNVPILNNDIYNDNSIFISSSQFNNELSPPTSTTLKNDNTLWYWGYINNSPVPSGFTNIICSNLNINEISSNNFYVFPNPIIDKLFILENTKVIDYEIYDVSGKFLKKDKYQGYIDFINYEKGIYFIKINSKGKGVTKKIIKI